MVNVHNKLGYLIYNKSESNRVRDIHIELSVFDDITSLITGDEASITIESSVFKNFNNPSFHASIADTQYSHYNINNCVFQNIKLYGSSLFNSESHIVINNSLIDNVTTNYKSIIDTNYNDLELYKTNITNINLYGDIDESFIIYFEAENKQNSIILENVNFSNIISNGNLIKLDGNNAQIKFNNVTVDNIDLNGSFLKSEAEIINCHFDNFIFSNNTNINKSGTGFIQLENNITLSINNSGFFNNDSSSYGLICNYNGGIIYFNVKNSNDTDTDTNKEKSITINNSIFQNNNAKYFGGVFYISLYKTCKINLNKNKFIENNAGVAGGVIFFEHADTDIKNYIEKYIYNKKNNNFENNNAISHGNIFASHPYQFVYSEKVNDFSIYSGGSISFEIVLQDVFGNIVNDREKYYSEIGIYAELLDKDKYNIENMFLSNIPSTFVNGKNIVNSLLIYTEKAGTYYLQITPKQQSNNLLNNTKLIYKINIKDCDSSFYKLTTKNNLFYCSEPICSNECKLMENYVCIKGNESINSDKYNTCKCKPGWKGDMCSEKDYFDSNKYKNKFRILSISLELIFIIIIIYILLHKDKKIITDSGLYSFIFISLGCIMKIISNNYIFTDSLKNCYMKILFSSMGFIIIYIPYTIKLTIASTFSLKFKKSKKDIIIMKNIFSTTLFNNMFLINKDLKKLYNTIYSTNNNPYGLKKDDTQEMNGYLSELSIYNSSSNLIKKNTIKRNIDLANNKSNIFKSSSGDLQQNNSLSKMDLHRCSSGDIQNSNENSKSNLKRLSTHSDVKLYESNYNITSLSSLNLNGFKNRIADQYYEFLMRVTYIEILIILFTFIIFIALNLYYIISMRDKQLIDEQLYDGLYAKICPKSKLPTSIYLLEFTLLLYNIFKNRKVFSRRYIMKEAKLAFLVFAFWLFIDPGINIILEKLFSNNAEMSQKLQYYSTFTCSLIIFISYNILTIYLLFIKKGDYRPSYFLSVPKAQCLFHNSYICYCAAIKIETYTKDELQSIDEYINFYNENYSAKKITFVIFTFIQSFFSFIFKNIKKLINKIR
ncbi:hypothetical protein BCR32DRAFT_268747 [Anaeromyces robustus]|uniref:EGF-like domain-containing protein n=1 Tax=Anaeromyces robustus TaxID=1754192 RepID=A0A1Y1X4N2_9FUNG|nr:hypothetical protein BCR32DRAFT_268747 [Anaeromyces robustus]|eukprot:ORX80662.1 hypothetical protein BCR32DRAFT_268747 [Anaeromyces robustus]